MIRYENECVGCPQGCIDCGRRHVPRCYCDECGEEIPYDSDRWDENAEFHYCEDCDPDEEEEEEDE